MIKIKGLYWPDDVAEKWKHSLRHVQSLEWSLARCAGRRTAVQAGGNMGLWPRRMAEAGFAKVITFEPDAISRECLQKNVPAGVIVRPEALGAIPGRCSIEHRSLGSHNVTVGTDVDVVTVDGLELVDVDLLQLDLEGYEWHAMKGAVETIERCRPLIQVELRDFTLKYGRSDVEVFELLRSMGYRVVSQQPGNDYVFESRQRS